MSMVTSIGGVSPVYHLSQWYNWSIGSATPGHITPQSASESGTISRGENIAATDINRSARPFTPLVLGRFHNLRHPLVRGHRSLLSYDARAVRRFHGAVSNRFWHARWPARWKRRRLHL